MQEKTRLSNVGLKATTPRMDVMSLLGEHTKPIDVTHLLSDVHRKKLSIDQATIYRMLEIFYQKGIVNRLDFGEGKYRYELAGKEHHHLICEQCGKIEDMSDCNISELEKEISKKKKFIIKRHSLEFFGLCRNCQY